MARPWSWTRAKTIYQVIDITSIFLKKAKFSELFTTFCEDSLMLPNTYIYQATMRLIMQHGEQASLIAIDQACHLTDVQHDDAAHQVLMQVRGMLESILKLQPDHGEYYH